MIIVIILFVIDTNHYYLYSINIKYVKYLSNILLPYSYNSYGIGKNNKLISYVYKRFKCNT